MRLMLVIVAVVGCQHESNPTIASETRPVAPTCCCQPAADQPLAMVARDTCAAGCVAATCTDYWREPLATLHRLRDQACACTDDDCVHRAYAALGEFQHAFPQDRVKTNREAGGLMADITGCLLVHLDFSNREL